MAREANWDWASDESAKLDSSINSCTTSLSTFGSEIITNDKDIKKTYKDKQHLMETELDKFNSAIGTVLKTVSFQTRLILDLNDIRMRMQAVIVV